MQEIRRKKKDTETNDTWNKSDDRNEVIVRSIDTPANQPISLDSRTPPPLWVVATELYKRMSEVPSISTGII